MKNYLPNKAITKNTLAQYLKEKYGEGYKATLEKSNFVKNVTPLLQNDYGLAGDCTITSMTCIMEYIYKKPIQEIYDAIEAIDMKFGYDGNFGTIPMLINTILRLAEKKLKVSKGIKWRSGYLKDIGFNFNTIMRSVEQQHPMILSIMNDGRNYYRSHSVTVIGYMLFTVNGRKQRFLRLQDNWTKEQAYLDYEILQICSLNYYL